MKPQPGTGPQQHRVRNIALVALVVVMCAAIALSQWYAVHHNIPYYQHKIEQKK